MPGLALTFLLVSIISLAIQAVSLNRLVRQAPAKTPLGRMSAGGLRRTAVSRVLASTAYVMSAGYALRHPEATEVSALLTFTLVQVMWWGNTVADVRLRKRLTQYVGKHRR